MLTVTAATLQSIAVTPANPSIAKGATQQFTATGTFSDGTTQNLTSHGHVEFWHHATATISAAGLATGAGVGTSTIKATSGAINGSTVAHCNGGDAAVDRGNAGKPVDRQGRDATVHRDRNVQRRHDAEPDVERDVVFGDYDDRDDQRVGARQRSRGRNFDDHRDVIVASAVQLC